MPDFATTLAAAATAIQAKLLVDDAAAADGGFYVQIDEELIFVERGGATTRRFANTDSTRIEWQVKRGQLGSVAASHADEADVTEVVPTVGTEDPSAPPTAGGGDAHAASHAIAASDVVTPAAIGAQAVDADLTAIAALTSAADRVPYSTGAQAWALATLTAAGRALIDDADAGAQLTTLGLSTFVKTLMDDANAAAFFTTLGISAFVQTILDDADAGAAQTTLGISTFVKTILDDADAAAVRTTVGAGTYSKPSTPQVAASPTAQGIVDALVTLGLITQAA